MNDQNSFVEQEIRTVQEIFDTDDGSHTTSVEDAEFVVLDRTTGSKVVLRRKSKLRTADGSIVGITEAIVCRSCRAFVRHDASTRCNHRRATTCVSCAGILQECKASQRAQWWPRFWTWLCSV